MPDNISFGKLNVNREGNRISNDSMMIAAICVLNGMAMPVTLKMIRRSNGRMKKAQAHTRMGSSSRQSELLARGKICTIRLTSNAQENFRQHGSMTGGTHR